MSKYRKMFDSVVASVLDESENLHPMNYTRSGGEMNVKMRRLHTYTLHPHTNGTVKVTDDHDGGKLVGGGFKTADDAVKHYEPFDKKRISMH